MGSAGPILFGTLLTCTLYRSIFHYVWKFIP